MKLIKVKNKNNERDPFLNKEISCVCQLTFLRNKRGIQELAE